MELPAHCSNSIPIAQCSQSKALNVLQNPYNSALQYLFAAE